MDNKFIFEKENGEQVECEKVLSFYSPKYFKNYMLFTDNKENKNGELNLYAYYVTDKDDTMYPVEDKEEFDFVTKVFELEKEKAQNE